MSASIKINLASVNKTVSSLTAFTLLLALAMLFFEHNTLAHSMLNDAFVFAVIWISLAIFFTVMGVYSFSVGFLLSVFSLLTAWRILELHAMFFTSILLGCAFALKFLHIVYYVSTNIRQANRRNYKNLISQWQLVFIRMYVGYDFIPHFTEKLFAGSSIHMIDVNAFTLLNVPHPDGFVWLAGLCEFAAALSLSTGLFLRLGAFGATGYLIIATYLGNHFSLGFIWVNHGGGWEFAVMWMAIIFSFGLSGMHDFSIDQWLEARFNLPSYIKKIL